MSWWWLAPWVVALAAVPFVWRPLWQMASSVSLTPASAPATPSSQLGFSATHEGSDWKLVWSREALTRLNALGAMLTIRDGEVERLQFLSPQDLAAGAVFYVPRTNDLTFNLKVTVPNAPEIEEQIRVLGAGESDQPQFALPVAPRRPEAAREVPARQTSGQPAAPPAKAFQPPRIEVARAAPADTALPEVPLPTTAVPHVPQSGPVVPAPPKPAPAAPSPAATKPEAAKPEVSSAPAAGAPKQAVSPAPTTGAAKPAAPAGVVTRTDASPLRTVAAHWPRNIARHAPVDVRVRVRIDARGQVTVAEPVQRTVANFPFVDSALAAARLWVFSPALENGKPVPSESVLTFKFTP